MIRHFDHVTIAVRDLEEAKRFFGLLDFEEVAAVVIKGPPFDAYMGVPGIEADHVTMVLKGADPRTEVQLLRYRHPAAKEDPAIRDLARLGFNHVCFAVDDIEKVLARMTASGFSARNEIMDFRSRRLVFLNGPEGVTIELSQWQ